jgi:hypothetical protein
MAKYVLYFLDWKLKQGYEGQSFYDNKPEVNGVPDGLLSYTFFPPLDVPPSTKELLAINSAEGFVKMMEEVKKYQQQDSTAFSYDTYTFIGQQLITEHKYKEGVQWAANFQELFQQQHLPARLPDVVTLNWVTEQMLSLCIPMH